MSGLPERIFFIVRADGTLSQVLSSRHEAKVHSEISGQPFVEYRFVGREAGAAKAQILDAAREASAFDQCVAEMRSRTRAPAHSVTAQGLLGRLDFVINNVAAPDGRRWSERRWCLAAGLSSATLASFRFRAHNPKSVLEPDSVAMLAHVAGVSARWLATGEGSHDEAVKP